MDATLMDTLHQELQRERRELVNAARANDEELNAVSTADREEVEERAQRERDALTLEPLGEAEQARLRDIDSALARMDAGIYERCENCGKTITEERLRAEPAVRLCSDCARRMESPDSLLEAEGETTPPRHGQLPPDLDGLDDDELARYLSDLVREDDRIDAQELQISTRAGVVYLEGALPSEPEHEMLRNILTDIAGIREIVDHLEVRGSHRSAQIGTSLKAPKIHHREIFPIASPMAARKTSTSRRRKASITIRPTIRRRGATVKCRR